jgi:hypothetical protein
MHLRGGFGMRFWRAEGVFKAMREWLLLCRVAILFGEIGRKLAGAQADIVISRYSKPDPTMSESH